MNLPTTSKDDLPWPLSEKNDWCLWPIEGVVWSPWWFNMLPQSRSVEKWWTSFNAALRNWQSPPLFECNIKKSFFLCRYSLLHGLTTWLFITNTLRNHTLLNSVSNCFQAQILLTKGMEFSTFLQGSIPQSNVLYYFVTLGAGALRLLVNNTNRARGPQGRAIP